MQYTYSNGHFPGEYQPTVLDNEIVKVLHDGQSMDLGVWMTAGGEDYDRLRPLSYPQTDVFILCFSVVQPTSFENIAAKWVPELRTHCPYTPILLVGTQADLREDIETKEKLARREQIPVTVEQAESCCVDVGAFKVRSRVAILFVIG